MKRRTPRAAFIVEATLDQTAACATMVARALQWISQHLADFDPFKDGRAYEVAYGKRVGELALMLRSYIQLTGEWDSQQIQQMIALVESVQRDRAFTDRLMHSPMHLVLFGNLYALQRLLGADDADQREVIQRVIDAGLLYHTERVPHRMMEVRLCLDWGEFQHSWPDLDALAAVSILRPTPQAVHLSEDGLYALTHAIMFLYDLGARKQVGLAAEERAKLRQTLGLLLVTACQEHHWDLLGELLVCCECMGCEADPIYERAWAAFLAAQRDDGAIPGPEWVEAFRKPPTEADGREQLEERYFNHHYHTTLVGILAGSLRARRSAGPEAAPSGEADFAFPQDEEPVVPAGLSAPAAASVRRAQGWLEQVLDQAQREADSPPDVWCKALLGWWMCDSLIEPGAAAFPALARRVGPALAARDRQERGQFTRTPATVQLLVAALLASQEVIVPSLHRFLLQTTELLNALPAEDTLADMALSEKRVLLHALGLHSPPGGVDYAAVMEAARALPLSSAAAGIEDLLLRIDSCTACGTRSIVLDPADGWIRELLAGLATHFLRQYDFGSASRLLRAMAYLGVGTGPGFEEGMAFLHLHQRPEGAFGFFGREEAALRAAQSPRLTADQDLYLPVTLSCLWAVGEGGNSGWRLYEQLPNLAGLPGTQAARAGETASPDRRGGRGRR